MKRRLGGLYDLAETITAYALDLSMFLNESKLTERRAFIESFVKEIVVMPDDIPIPGRDAEEMALNGPVLSTVKFGGAEGNRTPDLLNAIQALSQLSYSPTGEGSYDFTSIASTSGFIPRELLLIDHHPHVQVVGFIVVSLHGAGTY